MFYQVNYDVCMRWVSGVDSMISLSNFGQLPNLMNTPKNEWLLGLLLLHGIRFDEKNQHYHTHTHALLHNQTTLVSMKTIGPDERTKKKTNHFLDMCVHLDIHNRVNGLKWNNS